ncbi:hypothetical protein V6N13_052709 [Hibiscus sabdariffa]
MYDDVDVMVVVDLMINSSRLPHLDSYRLQPTDLWMIEDCNIPSGMLLWYIKNQGHFLVTYRGRIEDGAKRVQYWVFDDINSKLLVHSVYK